MIQKLLNKKMKFLKNQKGLTLIELLVVIVILGIIAAIAIPMFLSNQTEANAKAAEQTNSIVKDATIRHDLVESTPATTINDLLTDYIEGEPSCPDGYTDTGGTLQEYCIPE